MKPRLLAATLTLGLAMPGLAIIGLAQAQSATHDTMAAKPAATAPHMTRQQVAAMNAKVGHVQTLIDAINKSYGTQFAIASTYAPMAMAHMARADMDMAKAMMEMQALYANNWPGAHHSSEPGMGQ